MNEIKGDASAIIEAVTKLQTVELKELPGGVVVASVPQSNGGRVLQSVKKLVDEYRERPERKEGTATITEPASFVDFVNRHKDAHSVLFASADKDSPSVTAVFDYHQIGESAFENGSDGARFCKHRAVYKFPLSDEWKAWVGSAGYLNAKDQAGFAEFIEDRIQDIAPPHVAGERTKAYLEAIECELAQPSRIASLSRELSIRVTHNVQNAVRLASGETQMVFKEEHRDQNGEPVKVPGAFLIQIPIFSGGLTAVLPVRLRYRVQGGAVVWFYELALVDELFKLAIDQEIAKIQAGTELPVFVGSPEQ